MYLRALLHSAGLFSVENAYGAMPHGCSSLQQVEFMCNTSPICYHISPDGGVPQTQK